MEKMTNVSCLNDVLNGVALTDEHREKIEKMIQHFQKANTKSDKPTKNQIEREKMAMHIYDTMSVDEKYTLAEIIKGCAYLRNDDGTPFNTQKVAPMMALLYDRKLVSFDMVKQKKVYQKIKLAE